MRFGDGTAHGQAEAHTGRLAGNKRLEEVLAGGGGDARSIVGDHYQNMVVVVAFHEDRYAAALTS